MPYAHFAVKGNKMKHNRLLHLGVEERCNFQEQKGLNGSWLENGRAEKFMKEVFLFARLTKYEECIVIVIFHMKN